MSLRLEKTVARDPARFGHRRKTRPTCTAATRATAPHRHPLHARLLARRLTVPCESTVMLIQHPQRFGFERRHRPIRFNRLGSNSGPVALNAPIKDSDDLRQLDIVKNNRRPTGKRSASMGTRGVCAREPGRGLAISPGRAESKVDELFLQLLDKATAQGRAVRPTQAPAMRHQHSRTTPTPRVSNPMARRRDGSAFQGGEDVTKRERARLKYLDRTGQ